MMSHAKQILKANMSLRLSECMMLAEQMLVMFMNITGVRLECLVINHFAVFWYEVALHQVIEWQSKYIVTHNPYHMGNYFGTVRLHAWFREVTQRHAHRSNCHVW